MSTFTASLNKDNPKARFLLSYPMYPSLYDPATGHWLSGYIISQVTNLTWTGSGTSGETVRITIRPVRHNACCNDEVEYTPDASTNAWGGTSYKHVTALNYGVPDSSSWVEADNVTVGLVEVIVGLESNDFPDPTSSIALTLTYSVAQSTLDVFSAIGGTQYSNTLSLTEGATGAWAMVTSAELGTTVYAAVTVQLKTLVTAVQAGADSPAFQPWFSLSNPAQIGGQPIANIGPAPVPMTVSNTLTYDDYYSYVFAVNKGKISQEANKIGLPSSNVYNLCNFGLEGRPRRRDTASAVLTYTVLETSL